MGKERFVSSGNQARAGRRAQAETEMARLWGHMLGKVDLQGKVLPHPSRRHPRQSWWELTAWQRMGVGQGGSSLQGALITLIE